MWLWVLLACSYSDEEGSDTEVSDYTWYQDVQPVMDRSCAGCHTEGGTGGFALDSYEAAQPWATAIGEVVASRTMPPWGGDPDCNQFVGDLSLSEDEIDVLVDWASGGAPEGDAGSPGAALDPIELAELAQVDVQIDMPEAYTPSMGDDYRCFLLDWEGEETTYVTGFDVLPGTSQVHHVIAFLIQPDDADDYRDLDEEDTGLGYACYGGPGGDIQTLIDTKWLGSWAPGVGASNFPEGTGITVKAGSLVAVQVHYNVLSEPEPDQSIVQLSTTDSREYWGDLQPWTEVAWLFGGMEIPANTDGVSHTFEYPLSTDESFRFYSTALHMHTLGVSAEMVVEHDDGTETCLARVPSWDFDWQRSYELVEPVDVADGDTIRLTCTWDNPTDEDVYWGDGTTDEMCLGVSYIADTPE